MHFSQLLCVSVLAAFTTSITASPVVKRGTAQDIISDVNAIDSGVKTQTSDVSSFNSGSFPASLLNGVPIFVDVVSIHVSNRKGFLDATTASTFSEDDSIAIVHTVENTVVVSIPNAVNILKSKKQLFEEAGQTPVVIASLELLLNDHDTFSAAVLEKLTLDANTLAEANAGVALIHNALEDGIAFFKE